MLPAMHWWRILVVAGVAGVGACAASPPRSAATAKNEARPSLDVQRVALRVAPLEITASGVRGQAVAQEAVTIKNTAHAPLVVMRLMLVGAGTDVFSLLDAPSVSRTLMPGQSLDVSIRFAPPVDAALGVHRATLQIFLGPDDDLGPLVDVAGLVTQGEEGAFEPPLAQVVAALGFGIDVGGAGLILGTSAEPIGDQVRASLFRRAKPGPIAVDPVARYSPPGELPYGTYRPVAGKPKLERLGALAADQHQRLHPEWEGEGRISFDPGPEPFGLYVASREHTTFTDASLNTGPTKHATRVYPLKTRNGERVADAYLVGFEEAKNGDYQDYVFVLWNVTPEPDAPLAP